MATCYMMVGLPASGKSFRVNEMTTMNPDAYVYSTDNIVERIADQLGKTYSEVWEKHIKSATQEADIMVAQAMKDKLDVIWDQTNLSVNKRKGIIRKMQKAGYEVVCECFIPPTSVADVAEWNLRLHSRPGKVIPEFVMKSMINSYVIPTHSEGFTDVIYYNIYGEETNEFAV